MVSYKEVNPEGSCQLRFSFVLLWLAHLYRLAIGVGVHPGLKAACGLQYHGDFGNVKVSFQLTNSLRQAHQPLLLLNGAALSHEEATD